jgi:hypothetical protein
MRTQQKGTEMFKKTCPEMYLHENPTDVIIRFAKHNKMKPTNRNMYIIVGSICMVLQSEMQNYGEDDFTAEELRNAQTYADLAEYYHKLV